MADFFTPDQIDLLAADEIRCVNLVKFEFATSTVYAWNGETELVIGGNTYLPMHGYGQIDGMGYAGGTASEVVTLVLDGLPGQQLDFLATALAETAEAVQRIVSIYILFFDSEWQPIGLPVPLFMGFMQPPKISRSAMTGESGGTQSISISAENIYFNRSKPPFGRNTHSDQNARSLGDKFFGFVSSLLYKVLTYPDY